MDFKISNGNHADDTQNGEFGSFGRRSPLPQTRKIVSTHKAPNAICDNNSPIAKAKTLLFDNANELHATSDIPQSATQDATFPNEPLPIIDIPNQMQDVRKSPRRVAKRKIEEEFLCILCKDILIEPVVLPCNDAHRFCKPCFDEVCDKCNLVCPICRRRLSNWLRRSKSKIIDVELWEKLQHEHSVPVQRRLSGLDGDCDAEGEDPVFHRQIVAHGAIGEEYKAAVSRLEKEREQLAQQEFEASQSLIEASAEEARKAEKEHAETMATIRKDEELAQKIQENTNEIDLNQTAWLRADEEYAKKLSELLNNSKPYPHRNIAEDCGRREYPRNEASDKIILKELSPQQKLTKVRQMLSDEELARRLQFDFNNQQSQLSSASTSSNNCVENSAAKKGLKSNRRQSSIAAHVFPVKQENENEIKGENGNQRALNACPVCNKYFQPADIIHHASMCMPQASAHQNHIGKTNTVPHHNNGGGDRTKRPRREGIKKFLKQDAVFQRKKSLDN